MANSLSATVTQTGFATASKTYVFGSDSDIVDLIAAYQGEANAAVGGTATRNQVLSWVFDNILIETLRSRIAQNKTVITVGVKPTVT